MSRALPIRVAVIGCGAVVEQFHAPALVALAGQRAIDVIALCDPDVARLDSVGRLFPRAAKMPRFADVLSSRPQLALVASPAGLHAAQTIALLDAGVHVFCEKPLAPTAAEANRMIAAAAASQRLLAVGLFRRLLPVAGLIRDLIATGRLGAFESGSVLETGGFQWPFRTASAFLPELTPGGILLDLGVHVLDLLVWWFPSLRLIGYEDDAMGGVESTAVAALRVSEACVAVRLSRDWPMPARYEFQFEHARIVWDGVSPLEIELEQRHSPAALLRATHGGAGAPSLGDCFLEQLTSVIAAARGESAVAVGGSDALASLRLIEQCYRTRALLLSPWFSEAELHGASIAASAEAAS